MNRHIVWTDGKWVDLKIDIETIKVKGQDDIQLKVRRSKHGPILNDVIDTIKDQKEPIALTWAFHDFDNNMGAGYYGIAHAKDAFDAGEAVRFLKAPGLNFVLADMARNIAWWASGVIPIRPAHVDPNFILDGASGKDDYLGIYSFDKNP
ncbi:MAG: penicillin acylase family protein [Deltaproteobacteria bacterium]|jgi:penicillin amidase|nr:penicillin acylase family protein [Deltaproteobacteria bacterium]